MTKDIRYAFRSLLKRPTFASVAIITLALGIGANTAIFSVVNAVLLRPLPYQNSDRLVMVWGNFLKLNIDRIPAKAGEYEDYRDQSETFEQVAAFYNENVTLAGGDQPERITGAHVTANLFPMLGASVALGRSFAADDNQLGREHVAVLSQGLWRRHFGGDEKLVGHTIKLNDQDYTVIGVMAAGFQFPHASFPFGAPAEVWMPVAYSSEQASQRQGPYYLNVMARLKPGVSLTQARADMSALGQRFEQQQTGYRGPKGEDGGWRITVVPVQEEAAGNSRSALLVLSAAVGLVLLIACANVANLLSVRGTMRRRELAIRSALGASGWRIARQMLIEGLVLAGSGAGLGLLLAFWGVELLRLLSPASLPRVQEINVDARVLAFTVVLALLTGVLVSLWPALRAKGSNLQSALRESGAAVIGGWRRQYWRNTLVVVEVALSLLLLIGAGLLVNGLLRLQQVNLGVAPDKLLTAEINLPESHYREATKSSAFYRELRQRVAGLPGVQAASLSTAQPLSGARRNDPFAIEGRPLDPTNLTFASWQIAGPDYFRAIGVAIERGRDLAASDADEAAPVVAVINETMARRYWPNEDPVGRRISLGLPRPDNPWITIVGIARDLPPAIDGHAEPGWYLSRALTPQLNRFLLVRTAGDSTDLAAAIRREVLAIDRDQPVTNIKTTSEVIAETIAPRRFSTFALSLFAALALGLAALGIYSVVSYSVTLRTQEIGIRMALGARTQDILRLVVGGGMTLALVGVAIGLAGAFALTRLMTSLLFGVTPTDAVTYGVVSIFLIFVSFLACYIPARRATKVDPLVALRHE